MAKGYVKQDGKKEQNIAIAVLVPALRTDPVSVYQLFQPCFFWRGWRV